MPDDMFEALRVAREQLALPGLSENLRRIQDELSGLELTALDARAMMQLNTSVLEEAAREAAKHEHLLRDLGPEWTAALRDYEQQSTNLKNIFEPAWNSRLSAVFNDMVPHSALEIASRLLDKMAGIKALQVPPLVGLPAPAARAVAKSPVAREMDLAGTERTRRKLARRRMRKQMEQLTIEVVALHRALDELSTRLAQGEQQEPPPQDERPWPGQYL